MSGSADADSTYVLSITVKDLVRGCDSTVVRYLYVSPLPKANFTSSGSCIANATNFTDASTGTSLSYKWNFGDGKTASTQNPSHTYASIGTYNVQEIVMSSAGCSDSITQQVTINAAPIAVFSVQNSSCPSQAAVFTDSSYSVSTGITIASRIWAFGDGDSSTAANPTHNYAAAGSYTAILQVTSSAGCVDTISHTVIVGNGPVASFKAKNTSVCLGDSTSFTNSSTPTTGLTYSWIFGDGGTSSAQSPEHLYASSGSYTVKLYVTTLGGCLDSAIHTITINPKPTAAFYTTPTSSACVGDVVSAFDQSVNNGSGSLTYFWTWGDGGTSIKQNPTRQYTAAGNYRILLTVSAGSGGCPDTISQSMVIYAKPVAKFGYTQPVCENTGVQFTDSSTGGTSYSWDFGDGSGTSKLQNPSYTYSVASTYKVVESVKNASGCIDTISRQVTVNAAPNATFAADTTTNSASVAFIPSSNSYEYYIWDFGDTTSSSDNTATDPVHNYAHYGTHKVTLAVTTFAGCTSTDSLTVTTKQTKKGQGINNALVQLLNMQIAPNPFTSELHIDYTLPENEQVRLSIYDVTGKEIVVLADGNQTAGKYQFTVDADKYNMNAGVYFMRAIVGGQAIDQKIIRIR